LPDETEVVAVPLLLPLHDALVAVALAIKAGGSVIVTVVDAVHPAASVTRNVYVPAVSPEADVVLPPDGDHEYVYGALPVITVARAAPLLPPLHVTFCVVTAVVVTAAKV
jgi:hypothetical protein